MNRFDRPYGVFAPAVLDDLYAQLENAQLRRDKIDDEIADLERRIQELESVT